MRSTNGLPLWFRAILYSVFAIGFCATLLFLVRPPDRPATTEIERKAFEIGYLLHAHSRLCKNKRNKAAGTLAHQLEAEIRGRLTASDQGLAYGGCPLATGSDMRRGMSPRSAMYELLGETAYDVQGVKGALPAPMSSVLADVTSGLRDTPMAAALAEFGTGSRDANHLHRGLFGGRGLPFHDEIRAMQQQGAPK